MVAPRKTRRIVCTVIAVPANDTDVMLLDELTYTERPSNRLPWSDPIIARLVSNLQDEVRSERRKTKLSWLTSGQMVADLDPPSPGMSDCDDQWEWREQPRWSWPD
jgi:hypothetical protein